MKYIISALSFLLILRLCLFYLFPIQLYDGQQVSFSAVLLADPKIFGNDQEFSLRYGNFWQSTNVRITTNADLQFGYGQTLHVIGHVKILPRSGGLQPRTPEGQFNVASTLFDRLLENKNIIFAIQNPQIEAVNSGFLPVFGAIRAKILNFCENNFSQPYSGLLVGIIFGIKSLLTQQVTTSFRITGLSHIVAASGMNVTLVAGFLIGILGSFLKRKTAILVSLVGIFLYVCISGFDASIVRAALMGGLAFSASLFGRQYSGVYVLFLIGCLMLLWDPLNLIDVGFQLSVLATAGILLLTLPLAGQAPFSFLGEDFITTFAAQIATLPILLATFGQYSLLSILANLLVLWTIPIIMTIGGVGIMVGLVFEPLGKIIVWFSIPLIWYLNAVTAFFSTHAISVQVQNIPWVFIIGYYLLVGSFILYFKRKKIF